MRTCPISVAEVLWARAVPETKQADSQKETQERALQKASQGELSILTASSSAQARAAVKGRCRRYP